MSNIVSVLGNDYLNPCSINKDSERMFNLSSGLIFQGMLNIWKEGKELQLNKQFLRERIYSNEKEFHNPLSRNKQTLFENGVGKRKKKIQRQRLSRPTETFLENCFL